MLSSRAQLRVQIKSDVDNRAVLAAGNATVVKCVVFKALVVAHKQPASEDSDSLRLSEECSSVMALLAGSNEHAQSFSL